MPPGVRPATFSHYHGPQAWPLHAPKDAYEIPVGFPGQFPWVPAEPPQGVPIKIPTLIYIIKNVWRTRIALHKNSLHENNLHKNTKLTADNTKLITTNNKLLTKNTKLITKNNKLITKNTKHMILY